MPDYTDSITCAPYRQEDPPTYESKDSSSVCQVGNAKASSPSRKPSELSPELEIKVSKANHARILHLCHYKPSLLNNGGRIVRQQKLISKTNDAIMLPIGLSFIELRELVRSRMELKMADLGLESLEGMKGTIVLRGLGSVVVEAVDEQSWHSGRIFLQGEKGFILEYCVVTNGETKGDACCGWQCREGGGPYVVQCCAVICCAVQISH